ncbi:hypothetical protein CRUP_005674 [Coryphaenoides rupestris]|nr:hypothetical protein CRUP_005674 [Coryphaenoides rupestris]
MPAKFEEDSLIWIAGDTPLADSAFLSSKIKDLCGDLPIFWLRPTYTSGRRRASERTPPTGDGEEGTMTFDPMLDHQGICCIDCHRSYTQCQRICEPLGGYEPWPYHYRGCRVACRAIMPCRWWMGRILGIL